MQFKNIIAIQNRRKGELFGQFQCIKSIVRLQYVQTARNAAFFENCWHAGVCCSGTCSSWTAADILSESIKYFCKFSERKKIFNFLLRFKNSKNL